MVLAAAGATTPGFERFPARAVLSARGARIPCGLKRLLRIRSSVSLTGMLPVSTERMTLSPPAGEHC